MKLNALSIRPWSVVDASALDCNFNTPFWWNVAVAYVKELDAILVSGSTLSSGTQRDSGFLWHFSRNVCRVEELQIWSINKRSVDGILEFREVCPNVRIVLVGCLLLAFSARFGVAVFREVLKGMALSIPYFSKVLIDQVRKAGFSENTSISWGM